MSKLSGQYGLEVRRVSLIMLLLSVLSLSGLMLNKVSGQQPRPAGAGPLHSVRGKIFLPSGRSAEIRIRVTLDISSGGSLGDAFSDHVGNFEFRGVRNGNYILKVHADTQTFEPYSELLEINSSFSSVFTPQVYLRLLAANSRKSTNPLILSVADVQEVPKAARQLYEKAVKLAQANQPRAAIEKLQEALNVFPDYLHAINKLGEQCLQVGQREQAQAYFERAIAINERFAAPHIGLGTLLNEIQRYTAAIVHLEAAIKLDDTFPASQTQLGLALMELSPPDYSRAEKSFRRALTLGGKDVAHVYMHLFNLHIRQKHYAQAAEQLEAFLREKPTAPEAPQVRQRLEALKKVLAQASISKP